MKRSHLKRFQASNVRGPRTMDPNKTAAYDIYSKKAVVTTKENVSVVHEKFTIDGKEFIARKQIVRWGPDVHIQRANKNKLISERTNQVTYLGEVPRTVGAIEKIEDPRPKAAVVERLHALWVSERLSGFDVFEHYIVLYKFGECTVKMFHCGEKVCFVKEYPNLILRSYIYPTKALGMRAYVTEKLSWTIYTPPS